MAEMNLKQIIDKLNGEFTGEVRKLVFWYDSNGDFAADIDTIELNNAKVLHLEQNNQFYIKYFLECEDTTTNYLVYAPFSKPAIRDNHLADTIRYSKEFFADMVSLVCVDLGISEKFKPILQKYSKFFNGKDRRQRFYDFEIESFDETAIEVAIMSAICKIKTPNFEDVMYCLLTKGGLSDNKYLDEFAKYDLSEAFWKLVERYFGYQDSEPSLDKLVISMFITYISKNPNISLPQAWKPFVSYKTNNNSVFIDNMMNNCLYSEEFDAISEFVYGEINGDKYFANMDINVLVDCTLFKGIDNILINWMIERLLGEDIGVKLNEKNICDVCRDRRKTHFGIKYRNEYFVIENAARIISSGKYTSVSGIENLVKDYIEKYYRVDQRYRYFYYFYDAIEENARLSKLRELIENIYTNEYLNKITVNWNGELVEANGETGLVKQHHFYDRYIKNSNDRVVVIVSDAFRYEVAQSLFEKLISDEKCNAKMTPMQGVIPSYTPLGMSAVLPHTQLIYNENYNVVADGKICSTTDQKASLLSNYKINSKCVSFDVFKNMSQSDLRNIFTGEDVVYVMHNQVDACGDNPKTENEVFNACETAIEEIYTFIRRISSQANTHHFFITADHGFIYKRDKLTESDKIKAGILSSGIYGKRYVVSTEKLDSDGVASLKIDSVDNEDLFVSFPIGSDIFKTAGAGLNYVHGGTSPQEMIVPLIDVKVDKGRIETKTAEISLVSITNKVTNLITNFDFIQNEPVSDIVKETTYLVYLISENDEKISNENIIIADKKSSEASKRMFRLRFNLKNKEYNKTQKYYLVAYDSKYNIEVLRHEMIIDIAFANDFGFFS